MNSRLSLSLLLLTLSFTAFAQQWAPPVQALSSGGWGVAVDPAGKVWVTSNGGGVAVSQDGGKTFRQLASADRLAPNCYMGVIATATGAVVGQAQCSNRAEFVSPVNVTLSDTAKPAKATVKGFWISAVRNAVNEIVLGTQNWNNENPSIFLSSDEGATFKPARSPIPVFAGIVFSFARGSGNTLYATVESRGALWRSDDGGNTWQQEPPLALNGRNVPGNARAIQVSAQGELVVLKQGAGPWCRDSGGTWTRCAGGIGASSTGYSMVKASDGTLYAATAEGVWMTKNPRNGWTELDHPSSISDCRQITIGPDGYLYVITRSGKLYKTTSAVDAPAR